MQFLVKAYDGPDMLEKRMEVRPRHLEGMKQLGSQVICAGGLLDEEGKMKGSALVMQMCPRPQKAANARSIPVPAISRSGFRNDASYWRIIDDYLQRIRSIYSGGNIDEKAVSCDRCTERFF